MEALTYNQKNREKIPSKSYFLSLESSAYKFNCFFIRSNRCSKSRQVCQPGNFILGKTRAGSNLVKGLQTIGVSKFTQSWMQSEKKLKYMIGYKDSKLDNILEQNPIIDLLKLISISFNQKFKIDKPHIQRLESCGLCCNVMDSQQYEVLVL
ncbi:unnamed protein product (macronuclear) [Paramecium tetraurelia]|uniref:Uncharacterized protein n=1 Tax=Paramecium tetraurelia TaxID=5888 RepID=A0C7A4_PARTE|nr:uncharacterized protein GSPATT00035801001 [Paramecium tetraurelia]CAK66671.1 unnamed protein product [Paramecium tetraurelia]|eukprot:XP_001434068.1 hypothetical protein (macronuclear) [Paramecium tetraurelia strain d4-2]